MLGLIIAAAIDTVAGFFDEFTTQQCLAKGDIEANKVLDFFYRGDRPTPLQGYGVGAIVLTAEFTFYALMTRHVTVISPVVWIILCGVEAAVHVACAISNHKLATTGKAIFVL